MWTKWEKIKTILYVYEQATVPTAGPVNEIYHTVQQSFQQADKNLWTKKKGKINDLGKLYITHLIWIPKINCT